jgi:hypothetical protein
MTRFGLMIPHSAEVKTAVFAGVPEPRPFHQEASS